MSNLLDEFAYSITYNKATIIEERLKILLKPKPRYLPERLWKAILARLLVIEVGRRGDIN